MVNISQHLKKKHWKRLLHDDAPLPKFPSGDNSDFYDDVETEDYGLHYRYMTEVDFAKEIYPTAHDVNSIYQSTRPIQELQEVEITDDDGNVRKEEQWVTTGYDDVVTVALGIQRSISIKKATHFAGKGFWIANETKNDALFEKLTSWADTASLKTAYLEAVIACFQTGDAAIYMYRRGNRIEYQVFSFLKGDRLFYELDENRNPRIYRRYSLKGRTAVDVYACGYIETWVRNFSDAEETDKTWIEKVKNWFSMRGNMLSEDGYRLISRTDTQVSNSINQCVYFRVDDIPSGVAQQNIEKLEEAVSYNGEEVKNTSMPTLFLKAKKIENLPPIGSNGKVIGVRGSSEDLNAADAKYLEGGDHSNTYTSHVETLWNNIVRSTQSVFVEPADMKNGADSSAAFKLMFAPEEQWCMAMWTQFARPVADLTEVFKQLVGQVEGKFSEFADLRVSVGLDTWIPQNEKERIQMEIDQVNARVKSRMAAMADIGNSHIGDYEQIEKEWKDELTIKSEIPEAVKAKYGTTSSEGSEGSGEQGSEEGEGEGGDAKPTNPVDKRDKGRSIQDR